MPERTDFKNLGKKMRTNLKLKKNKQLKIFYQDRVSDL